MKKFELEFTVFGDRLNIFYWPCKGLNEKDALTKGTNELKLKYSKFRPSVIGIKTSK